MDMEKGPQNENPLLADGSRRELAGIKERIEAIGERYVFRHDIPTLAGQLAETDRKLRQDPAYMHMLSVLGCADGTLFRFTEPIGFGDGTVQPEEVFAMDGETRAAIRDALLFAKVRLLGEQDKTKP